MLVLVTSHQLSPKYKVIGILHTTHLVLVIVGLLSSWIPRPFQLPLDFKVYIPEPMALSIEGNTTTS